MKEQIAETMTGFARQSQVFSERDFTTKEEVVRDDGMRKFKLPVLLPDGNVTQELEVIVWSQENPFKDIPAMSPVTFKNLSIQFGFYKDREGHRRKFWNLVADSVKKA